MSRIGKLPIQIPSGVTITVADDAISVVGPKGQLVVPHLSDVTVALEDGFPQEQRADERDDAEDGAQEKIPAIDEGVLEADVEELPVGVEAGKRA